MILLSIDSGIEKTGYALVQTSTSGDPRLILSGTFITKKNIPTEKRLKRIFDFIKSIICKHKPSKIVLERLFFLTNKKTAITVSQTQGVLMYLAAECVIGIDFLTPLQIKQAITGYGSADKKAVQKMLALTYGIVVKTSHDDESDAIACALAYCILHKNEVQ